jgi:hypothetical protein
MYMGLHYLFTLADEDKADFFTKRLLTGEGLRLGSPILTLRNLAITRAQDEGRRGLGYWYYSIVKAWNFFYTDQELSAIHMGRNERTWLDIEGVPPDETLANTEIYQAVFADYPRVLLIHLEGPGRAWR